jgi:glycosyltransferase involved in cell wall biosynthesis
MPDVLNAADICCSLFVPVKEMEANSANKFFDALAAGRAVAINYGGWQAEILENSGAGLVLSANDTRQAAEDLRGFLSDKAALGRAHAKARELATGRFDRDRLTADVLLSLTEAAHSA